MDKQSEYLALNNQILALEKNAFERTALIGFIGFPCLGIMDNGFYYWIPFLIMLLLVFNFNYTIGNLKKAIHLKIYLQKVLEVNKNYISWANFSIYRENYIKTNKKAIKKTLKEYWNSEDVTIEQDGISRLKSMTFIFLTLYLTITIIFMNTAGQLSAMSSSGGYLAIITFIFGFFYVLGANNINSIGEKMIIEKVLNEIGQSKN